MTKNINQISMCGLQNLVSEWEEANKQDEDLLSKINIVNKAVKEPALLKHLACISDRILTRQCCIIRLQNLMLTERQEILDFQNNTDFHGFVDQK